MGNVILGAGEEGLKLLPIVVSEARLERSCAKTPAVCFVAKVGKEAFSLRCRWSCMSLCEHFLAAAIHSYISSGTWAAGKAILFHPDQSRSVHVNMRIVRSRDVSLRETLRSECGELMGYPPLPPLEPLEARSSSSLVQVLRSVGTRCVLRHCAWHGEQTKVKAPTRPPRRTGFALACFGSFSFDRITGRLSLSVSRWQQIIARSL